MALFSTYAGTFPAPTPKAGFPQLYASLTIAFPPVARIVATSLWCIKHFVASKDGLDIYWTQFFGAPALIAASSIIFAVSTQHFWAFGWNPKIIGFLVFKAINDLKITVEVGFVTGVTPQITPNGSATSVIPLIGSSLIIPHVFKCLILLTTYSQANKFLVHLSSKTPLPVSSFAIRAKYSWWSKTAQLTFATI